MLRFKKMSCVTVFSEYLVDPESVVIRKLRWPLKLEAALIQDACGFFFPFWPGQCLGEKLPAAWLRAALSVMRLMKALR